MYKRSWDRVAGQVSEGFLYIPRASYVLQPQIIHKGDSEIVTDYFLYMDIHIIYTIE